MIDTVKGQEMDKGMIIMWKIREHKKRVTFCEELPNKLRLIPQIERQLFEDMNHSVSEMQSDTTPTQFQLPSVPKWTPPPKPRGQSSKLATN